MKKVLGAANECKLRNQEYRKKGWLIDRLSACVCKKMVVPVRKLVKRWRSGAGSEARKAMAYFGHRALGIPVMDIACYFNISRPAVSMHLDEKR